MRDWVHQTMVFMAGGLFFLVCMEQGFELGLLQDERDLWMVELVLTSILGTYVLLWLVGTLELRRRDKMLRKQVEQVQKVMAEREQRKQAEAQLQGKPLPSDQDPRFPFLKKQPH